MDIKKDITAIEGYAAASFKSGDWRKWLLVALAILLLFGGGYATGHWAHPRVVTKVETKTVTVDKVVTVTKVETKVEKVYVHDKVKDEVVHKVVVQDKKPTGEVVTTTTEDVNATTKIHDTDNVTVQKQVDQKKTDDSKTVTDAKSTTKVAAAPGWRLGAGVGIAVPQLFLGGPEVGIPGLRGAVIQVEGARRLAGPLWIDLFGNTQGVVGLGLSGEF